MRPNNARKSHLAKIDRANNQKNTYLILEHLLVEASQPARRIKAQSKLLVKVEFLSPRLPSKNRRDFFLIKTQLTT